MRNFACALFIYLEYHSSTENNFQMNVSAAFTYLSFHLTESVHCLPGLVRCHVVVNLSAGTSAMLSSEVNGPVAHGSTWYGSWTNLTQTFRVCHLCTFNVAAIFFGMISTYGVLPYTMIYLVYAVLYESHSVFNTIAMGRMRTVSKIFVQLSLAASLALLAVFHKRHFSSSLWS